ncbi:MAG: DUF1835 domain-containing protein [Dehalococcoidia bacterium]|nr:DUF1835 domain-containing protein [Dehalococcoidia bacterium]
MLHITGGDAAADLIHKASLPGEVLPWRDVLHEGPVSRHASSAEFNEIRSRYIAAQGWDTYENVLAGFRVRDAVLARFQEHDEVVLWFEHCLYDQLQLIQILDWFAQQELAATQLTLICIGSFPNMPHFKGLGELSTEQIVGLFPRRQGVTSAEFRVAQHAWRAFCSPDPSEIEVLLALDTSALRFLYNALLRHLQQFPSVRDGLGRTEQQILKAVAAGKQRPPDIFKMDQAAEEHPFMGDAIVWSYIKGLASASKPLVRRVGGGPFILPQDGKRGLFSKQILALTKAGSEAYSGRADWVHLNGIDRWLGGVHLQGAEAAWRWDPVHKRLRPRPK